MHAVSEIIVKEDRTLSFHLGALEKHEDKIIIRCIGENIEAVQYALENQCKAMKIPIESTNGIYITLYKNVDFNNTNIEQQFTKRLDHQAFLIDKITMNNLSLGLPIMITKFINTTWANRAQ